MLLTNREWSERRLSRSRERRDTHSSPAFLGSSLLLSCEEIAMNLRVCPPAPARPRDPRTKRPSHSTVYLLSCAAALLLMGCTILRFNDAGRMKVATEAKASAADLSGSAGAVFGPMEENLDAVRDTQNGLRDLSNKYRFETFRDVFVEYSADDVAESLIEAFSDRADTIAAVDERAKGAAMAVNAALDRQDAITKANNETVADKTKLEEALQRVKQRLDFIDVVFANLDKLDQLSGKAGLADGLSSLATGAHNSDVDDLVAKAKAAIGKVDSDERVAAAGKLLKQAVQEVASSEQSRVLEMKRHLTEITRFKSDFDARERLSVCVLLVKVIGDLHPALKTQKTKFEGLVKNLRAEASGDNPRYDCFKDFPADPEHWVEADRRQRVARAWEGRTLAGFVVADVTREDVKISPATSPRLVASLGVFLFYEREYFERVSLDLAREQHRHSVRLSKTNAQERAQLVNQLAQGLEVYYQGGIKPEVLAQLLLMAGQVGALSFIGAQ